MAVVSASAGHLCLFFGHADRLCRRRPFFRSRVNRDIALRVVKAAEMLCWRGFALQRDSGTQGDIVGTCPAGNWRGLRDGTGHHPKGCPACPATSSRWPAEVSCSGQGKWQTLRWNTNPQRPGLTR
jgi:hypothetical protein